jgi:hypothetical protein
MKRGPTEFEDAFSKRVVAGFFSSSGKANTSVGAPKEFIKQQSAVIKRTFPEVFFTNRKPNT